MSNTIKHVWFDFAGTLFKETAEYKKVHRKLLYDTYASVKGITDIIVAEREFSELEKKYGSRSAVFRALGKPSDFWMKELDKLDFSAVLKPDREVSLNVAKIHEIVPISLFTNYVKYRIEELLKLLEIPIDQFTYILTGDDIEERKPALDGFRVMVEKSGLPADQLLYVGDRVGVDIKPAKQVGMQTCLVYATSSEADYCFDKIGDILNILS